MEEEMYQRFDLDLDEVSKQKKMFPTEAKSLIKGLMEKGYDVLESGTDYSGLPDSIIVIGKLGDDIKTDFYAISKELPYMSGAWYSKRTTQLRKKIGVEVVKGSGTEGFS